MGAAMNSILSDPRGGRAGGRERAFTLIELLVVMGIMVLLAGLTTTGIWVLTDQGRREEAEKTAVKIAADIGRFRFACNVYPWDLPVGNAEFVELDWKDVCKELDPTNDDLGGQYKFNEKMTQFMDFSARSRIRDGVFVDPWGKAYHIGWNRKQDLVVVWSEGKDGVDDTLDDLQGAGDGFPGDDVDSRGR